MSARPFPTRRRPRNSAALILILGCLVILAAVLMAFLNSAKTELASSKMYADNNDVHTMMNTCVNIVMTQIRQATTASGTDCWTSQPGLIRTFNNSGLPDMSYKLYSSDIMQTNGPVVASTEAAALANWSTEPAIYTDLNQSASGVYPILDPTATGTVQGYSVSGAPSTSSQSVPMPVKWLYVLSDGTLVPPVAGSSNTATIAGATASNPIVGRIAFWTDDESCKVNINTASEGTYWDVPKFASTTDQNMGNCQPVEYEYQGYPGHPATVSLSTVFPGLVSTASGSATEYNTFYSIAPRIQAGGSQNGTVFLNAITGTIALDSDRLYDSPDEVLFNTTTSTSGSITTRGTNSANLTETDLAKARFFITAHSRAPELTLFGTPKVACWPINYNGGSYVTAFDHLIATCCTLNNDIYYFQRQYKDSLTSDYANITRNQTLYSYLHTLMNTTVPGFGGNLGTKFGADSDQILTEIFDYIRCTNLNDLNLPTPPNSTTYYQYAPGSNTRGYGQDEVAPITITYNGSSTRGFGRFTTFSEASLWVICSADPTATGSLALSNTSANLTLPTVSGSTQLLTVNNTASPPTKQIRIEAALVLDPFTPMQAAIAMRPDIEVLISGMENWTIKGNSDTSAVNLGFPAQSVQQYSGSGAAGVYQLGTYPSNVPACYDFGGNMGTTYALFDRYLRARNSGRLPQDGNFAGGLDGGSGPRNEQYPFVSEPVTVNVTQTSPYLTFLGGPITVTVRQRTTGTILASSTSPGATFQTFAINYPQTTMPAPSPSMAGLTFQSAGCGVILSGSSATPGRFNGASVNIDTSNDVLYSMVLAGNNQTLDPRFLALTSSDTTGALFSNHPYFTPGSSGTINTTHIANTLIPLPGSGQTIEPTRVTGNTGAFANLGTNTYPYHYQPCPKVPYPATTAMNNGDWDNGIGILEDGGYVNEPDQGNTADTYSGSYITPYFNDHAAATTTFTSPSRTMPSPGMFGSLPTTFARSKANNFAGASNIGWQTLLFRRQPTHPSYTDSGSTASVKGVGGFSNAPDYLMMDLFWMPIVEPYAISELFSTAGKINMNYEIVPFNYINRQTGLYAVLKHEAVVSVPTSDYNGTYKNNNAVMSFTTNNYRRSIQIAPTLTQFTYRFNNSDGTGLYAFRSPSEICDIHLIPDDVGTLSTGSKTAIDTMMATYWGNHTLTGDNSRERPYTTIYPKLTTRSNTFRVHYRVQSLKKLAGSNVTTWTEGSDLINSEGRGSVLIERYLDANDTAIPDYASNPTATPSLESRYQFRVVSINRFAP